MSQTEQLRRRNRRRWRILEDLNRELNLRAPLVEPDPSNFMRPKGVEHWTANLHGKPARRMIIYLRSDVGCEFGVRTGGCLACRHFRLGTAGQRVELDEMYVLQYQAAVQEHGLAPIVCIYNEGNMLNERELPPNQLRAIVGDLSAKGVKRLVLESRPEYITKEALQLVRGAAGQMEVEIGIGMESANDLIRNGLFLKAMTRRAYARAVRRLKSEGFLALAYVILKPPFLNEMQAIADAVRTVRYAFDVGTDIVSLEPIGVEPHTIVALMEESGDFTPAWLWTVIEVARQTYFLGELRLGGVQFHPRPVTLPRNCDECTDRVLAAIDEYNLTYDFEVLDRLRCGACYPKYRDEIRDLSPEIDERRIEQEMISFQQTFASAVNGTLVTGEIRR